jgi:citronellyl-CoA dehydrogenase
MTRMTSEVVQEVPAAYPPFTAEHDLIRQTVKRFCREEIAPFAQEWDEAGIFPRELFRKAADLGLFGIRIPTELGGSGLDWWATAAAMESLAYGDSPGVGMALMVQAELTIPIVAEMGTAEQQEIFLKPAMSGEWIGALGISEPGGGSDVAALRTQARADGGDLIISGQKLWITNGTRADFIVLAVRTGETGYRGISLVLFPTRTPGFSVGKKLKKVGNLCSDTAELFFDDCRIPAGYVLGEKNRGFYYIMHNFQGERLASSIMMVASLQRCLDLAIQYGKQRSAFGNPVGSYQVWRHKFAEHLTSLEAGRWLVYRALDLLNRGQKAVREITMAKLYVSELAQRLSYDCMQIFGGFGYTTEYPISRYWRDLRLYTIGAGTSEIMKEIIAKEDDL